MLTLYRREMRKNDLVVFLKNESKCTIYKRNSTQEQRKRANVALTDGGLVFVNDNHYLEFMQLVVKHGSQFFMNERVMDRNKLFFDIENIPQDKQPESVVEGIREVVMDIFGSSKSDCVVLRSTKDHRRLHVIFYKLPLLTEDIRLTLRCILRAKPEFESCIDQAVYKTRGCSLRLPFCGKCETCSECGGSAAQSRMCDSCFGSGKQEVEGAGVYEGWCKQTSTGTYGFKVDELSSWMVTTWASPSKAVEEMRIPKQYGVTRGNKGRGVMAGLAFGSSGRGTGMHDVTQAQLDALTNYVQKMVAQYRLLNVRVKDCHRLENKSPENGAGGVGYAARLDTKWCPCKGDFHTKNGMYVVFFEDGRIYLKCFSDNTYLQGNCKTFRKNISSKDFRSVLKEFIFPQKQRSITTVDAAEMSTTVAMPNVAGAGFGDSEAAKMAFLVARDAYMGSQSSESQAKSRKRAKLLFG